MSTPFGPQLIGETEKTLNALLDRFRLALPRRPGRHRLHQQEPSRAGGRTPRQRLQLFADELRPPPPPPPRSDRASRGHQLLPAHRPRDPSRRLLHQAPHPTPLPAPRGRRTASPDRDAPRPNTHRPAPQRLRRQRRERDLLPAVLGVMATLHRVLPMVGAAVGSRAKHHWPARHRTETAYEATRGRDRLTAQPLLIASTASRVSPCRSPSSAPEEPSRRSASSARRRPGPRRQPDPLSLRGAGCSRRSGRGRTVVLVAACSSVAQKASTSSGSDTKTCPLATLPPTNRKA